MEVYLFVFYAEVVSFLEFYRWFSLISDILVFETISV